MPASQTKSPDVEHQIAFQKPGRYAGWPANYGMWRWGSELLFQFIEGTFSLTTPGHKRDKGQPFRLLQGRSVDDGHSWKIEPFNGRTPRNRTLCADEHVNPELQIGDPFAGENPPVDLPQPIDFSDPDTSVLVGRTTCKGLPNVVQSWFHVSRDHGRSWHGPYRFAGLDFPPHIAGRTDLIALSSHHALLMLSCHKSNGYEGRTFCAETRDGGRTFTFKSWIGHELENGYEIMPSSAHLPDGRILTLTRAAASRGGRETFGSINAYESSDGGQTWNVLSPVAAETGLHSNPPALVQLPGGRLAVVYGYRDAPQGIRGKVSDDGGRSWSDEIILREDGGDFDVGYPRAVVNAAGKVVTAYYYNTHTDAERFIGVTIWDAARV